MPCVGSSPTRGTCGTSQVLLAVVPGGFSRGLPFSLHLPIGPSHMRLNNLEKVVKLNKLNKNVNRLRDRPRSSNQSTDWSINQLIKACNVLKSLQVQIRIFRPCLNFDLLQNLGAGSTDPVNTTRTDTVIYGYDTNCYGYNG